MKQTISKKMLSSLLALTTIFSTTSAFSINTFAEEMFIDEKTIEKSTDAEAVKLSPDDIIEYLDYENMIENQHIERVYSEEDSLDTIIFLNNDGSETAYIFDENVKYINEYGDVTDKTNNLYSVEEGQEELENYSLVNYDNDIKSYFPQFLSIDDGILVKSESEIIELTPLIDSSLEVTEDDGSVVYYDAFGENTALKYTPIFSGCKEDIIINEYVSNEFTFLLNTNGLVPVISDKTVQLLDSSEEIVATINPIYVYDSTEEGSNITLDNYFQIQPVSENIFELTIVVDNEFLLNPQTEYPVIIDPTVTINSTSSGTSKSIIDTPIYNGSSVSYQTAGVNPTAIIGYVDNSYGSGRLLMSFPGLASQSFWNSDYNITSASLTLKELSGQAVSSTIYAYNYTGESWNESSTYSSSRWNGTGTALSGTSFSYPDYTLRSFDITSAVKKWKTDTTSFDKGIILKNNTSETDVSKRKIVSTTEGTTTPYLTVTYEKAKSPRPISDGIYYIRNKHSGKYIDITNNGTTNGTSVIQHSYHGNKNQQFKVTYETDGYYTIRPMHIANQTFALDMRSSALANTDGTDAQIWSYSSGYQEQKFLISSAIGGGYQIGTKSSSGSKVLEVTNSSMDNEAVVQIWSYSDSRDNDNWYFEKVNFGSAPSYSEIETSARDVNCAGFALRIPQFISGNLLGVSSGDSVETVATATKTYFNNVASPRTIRRISGINLTPTFYINENEYRVALRVATNGRYDYHYMIQLEDGSWAHKRGNTPSEYLGFINPSNYDWINGSINYDSNVIYFAVSY